MNRSYNIHEIFRFRIEKAPSLLIEDLNWKYSYFETPSVENPDLIVKIGKFRPNLTDCYCLDQKYYIKKNYIYFLDSDKRMSWEAEITGIEKPPLIIRFSPHWTIRLRFPWALFPYLILHQYVIDPLMEVKIQNQGFVFLHSGAVSRDGFAHLFAGRGGSYKTTYVMELVRRGYKLMSDDLTLIRDGMAYCLPTFQKWFSFNLKYLKTEEMGLFDRIRLFGYLARSKASSMEVIQSSRIKSLTLLLVANTDRPRIRTDLAPEDILRMAGLNHEMEKTSYVSFKYIIGNFLRAYEAVFPETKLSTEPLEYEKKLFQHLKGIALRVIEVPPKWDPQSLSCFLDNFV